MVLNDKIQYLRIGKILYKRSKKPLNDGSYKIDLIPWSINLFKMETDNWKNVYEQIPKYDSFCCFPSHQEYKRDIDGYYNKYEPLGYLPEYGDCNSIINLIKHVFGEQYDLGLDYLTIIYRYPRQILPILCIVSVLTNTSKTTFLNFLKSIYGDNMSILSNEDFSSNFNSNWATGKVIVGMEEIHLTDPKDSEKIKNASTAKYFNMEAKGMDKVEVEFFGKFILASNHEDDLIYIAPNETRFWVRKLNVVVERDPDYLDKLEKEIPAFLYLLKNREISCPKKTRMWFTPEQIETEQLRKIKAHFGDPIKYEILEIVEEITQTMEIDELRFTNSDMMKLLRVNGIKIQRMQLKKVLEIDLKINHVGKSLLYETYTMDQNGIPYKVEKKGKYYSIKSSK